MPRHFLFGTVPSPARFFLHCAVVASVPILITFTLRQLTTRLFIILTKILTFQNEIHCSLVHIAYLFHKWKLLFMVKIAKILELTVALDGGDFRFRHVEEVRKN